MCVQAAPVKTGHFRSLGLVPAGSRQQAPKVEPVESGFSIPELGVEQGFEVPGKGSRPIQQEKVGRDHWFLRENHSTLDDVIQFSDIAGPVVTAELLKT